MQATSGSEVEGREVEGREVEGRDVEGREVEGREVEGRDVEGSDVEASVRRLTPADDDPGPTTSRAEPGGGTEDLDLDAVR